MEKINYPLLCFKISEEAVLGILVGTEYEVVEPDLEQVKATLSDYLYKQYKNMETIPVFPPRCKTESHQTFPPTHLPRRVIGHVSFVTTPSGADSGGLRAYGRRLF